MRGDVEMVDVLQDHLKAVRERFTNLLDERLDELEVAREQIDLDVKRNEAFETIQFIAHKIAGTAGILGYESLGRQARVAENAIIQLATDGSLNTSDPDTLKVIDIFIETAAEISANSYYEKT